jgi:hypothetical protein
MKGKYITTQILLACLSKPANIKKDIHLQLEETIAERKRIIKQLEDISRRAKVIEMYLTTTKAA